MADKAVEEFYETHAQYEWERLERHRLEFATTWRVMQEYIPPAARILDIGGGPGRYSIHLALAGHRVTLFDLAAGNVAFAKAKAAELGAPVEGFLQGDALDLSRFADEAYDVVLLMGQLYHLMVEDDRRRALAEAVRVLKTGGQLFASFLTRYGFLLDLLQKKPGEIEAYAATLRELHRTGICLNPDGFTNAFFCDPASIEPLMASCGLRLLRLAGAEGLAMTAEPAISGLPQEAFAVWCDLLYGVATDPVTLGASGHALYVGVKQ